MATKFNRRDFAKKTLATAGVAAAGFYVPSLLKAAGDDEWADLTGRFVVEGTPPEPEKLKVDKDVECCGKFDVRDESLLVGKDGGLENVYVYLRTKTREKVKICPELIAALRARLDPQEGQLTLADNLEATVDFGSGTIEYDGSRYPFGALSDTIQKLIVQQGVEGIVKQKLESQTPA